MIGLDAALPWLASPSGTAATASRGAVRTRSPPPAASALFSSRVGRRSAWASEGERTTAGLRTGTDPGLEVPGPAGEPAVEGAAASCPGSPLPFFFAVNRRSASASARCAAMMRSTRSNSRRRVRSGSGREVLAFVRVVSLLPAASPSTSPSRRAAPSVVPVPLGPPRTPSRSSDEDDPELSASYLPPCGPSSGHRAEPSTTSNSVRCAESVVRVSFARRRRALSSLLSG